MPKSVTGKRVINVPMIRTGRLCSTLGAHPIMHNASPPSPHLQLAQTCILHPHTRAAGRLAAMPWRRFLNESLSRPSASEIAVHIAHNFVRRREKQASRNYRYHNYVLYALRSSTFTLDNQS